MTLLADYALTPDVFDATSYSSDEVCELCLKGIKDVLLTEGLVRDLRNGDWRRVFAEDSRSWHGKAKELLKKLVQQSRLVPFEASRASAPSHDSSWCEEALGTNSTIPFSGGVIATEHVKSAFEEEELVGQVDRLERSPWWAARSASVRPRRILADYLTHLEPVLRCANSITFIDPHLDPARGTYREFRTLLEGIGPREPAPCVEIHRVCYEGSGPSRRLPMNDEPAYFERLFRSALVDAVRAAGIAVEVFIWDDFHDRYMVSNLVGIHLSNGFDTSRNPSEITTWSRLGRPALDDVVREFDPASRRHTLRARFKIE